MRVSPAESATLYKVGAKKTGNDGNIWIIVENKNGVKRWKLYKKKSSGPANERKKSSDGKKKSKGSTNERKKSSGQRSRAPASRATAIELFNNLGLFEHLLRQSGKSKRADIAESSRIWTGKLIPAARDLIKIGIVLFIYPFGAQGDESDEEFDLYLQNNTKLLDFFNVRSDDALSGIPYLWYHAWVATSDKIILSHNVPSGKRNACFDLLKKHFGERLNWNKSERAGIIISAKKAKGPETGNDIFNLLMRKLKKDMGDVFKIYRTGELSDEPDAGTSEIGFDIDPEIVAKHMRSYGFKEGSDIDGFFIDAARRKLYFDVSDVSAEIYGNLK